LALNWETLKTPPVSDSLTPRMLEPARDGEPAGIAMNFSGMKEKFYTLMGLDVKTGIPKGNTGRKILEEFEMPRKYPS